jgi:hypothetical protein
MLQRWVDHNGVEHRVLDDYERNCTLVDLTKQPPEIKAKIDETITRQMRREMTKNVGIHFFKFCAKYELTKISEQATTYAKWLNSHYTGSLPVIDESLVEI